MAGVCVLEEKEGWFCIYRVLEKIFFVFIIIIIIIFCFQIFFFFCLCFFFFFFKYFIYVENCEGFKGGFAH